MKSPIVHYRIGGSLSPRSYIQNPGKGGLRLWPAAGSELVPPRAVCCMHLRGYSVEQTFRMEAFLILFGLAAVRLIDGLPAWALVTPIPIQRTVSFSQEVHPLLSENRLENCTPMTT